MFEAQIWKLGDKELPGAACWNAMARFLRGMQSANDYLTLNPRPGGGVTFDIDIEAIALAVKNYLDNAEDDPDLTKPEKNVALPSIKVYLYDAVMTIPKTYVHVSASDSGQYVWAEIGRFTATYKTSDNGFPTLIDIEKKTVNWPVCILTVMTATLPEDPSGTIYYYLSKDTRHHGDIIIPTIPHFMLDGYHKDEFRIRSIENGREFYYKPEDCEEKK